MNQRKQTLFRAVLVLGIIVLVNLIGVRIFTRIDLTESRMYTLSEASRNLVKSLDDKFLVKAYFTSDLPSPYNNNRRYLQDQLDEYRAYARGNFQYEFIDPSKNPELEQEAQRYGIPPVQVQVLKEDKFQIEKAYMGLVFLYGDKQERLPVIQSTANLEYEISSIVKKMASKELMKLGFLSGHGEPTLQQMNRLKDALEKQYELTTVDLSGGTQVPADISVLLIVAPKQPLKSWEKYLIDQYLMKGGKIAFFVNKVDANLQNQTGRPLNLDLDDLLEAYGVRINTDLVRDARCASVTVSQQAGFFVIQNQVPFPLLPMASEFSQNSPIVKDLGPVIFFFVSSIDTSLARSKGINLEVLVASSERSGRVQNVFIIDPTGPVTKEMFQESRIPLAASLEGTFASAFHGQPVGLDSTVHSVIDTVNRISNGKVSRVAVVGDGDFVQDQYAGGNRDNIIFAANLIDYLADDIGLATLRSRATSAKPLDEVSEGTKSVVKGLNLAAPPILVVLVGILRWRWRVSMRRRLESKKT